MMWRAALVMLALAAAQPVAARDASIPEPIERQTVQLAVNADAARQSADNQLRQLSPSARQSLNGLALRWVSAAARLRQGDIDGSQAEALAIERQAANETDGANMVAYAQLLLANIAKVRQDTGRAAELYQSAQNGFIRAGNRRGQGLALAAIAALNSEAGDGDTAIRLLNAARQAYPGDAVFDFTLRNNLGVALISANRPAEAEGQLREAERLAHSLGVSSYERAIALNVALAQLQSGRIAPARSTMHRIDAMDWEQALPNERNLLLRLRALISLQSGSEEQALNLIQSSRELREGTATDPTSRYLHLAASEVYRASGDWEKALTELELVRQIDAANDRQLATNRAALLAAQFRFSAQETRIARIQADSLARSIRAQRQMTWVIVVASASLLLLLAGLLVVAIRARNRAKLDSVALAEINEQLEGALAAKSQFLASTSHELRTPLNGILGMTQILLADRQLDPQTRARVDLVHDAGKTMRALVDDILDVAKVDHGGFAIAAQPTRPHDLVDKVVALFEADAARRGIRLRFDNRIGEASLMLDPGRLTQILFNLVGNALKFTAEGEIEVIADRRAGGDGALLLSVRDSGIGIASEWHEAVFDMFRQVDPSRSRQYGGTGLGLAICRRLARAMGGDIALESRIGEGSTFTVHLPWEAATIVAPEEVEAEERAAGRRIAIVANDPMRTAMLSAIVRRLGHIVVDKEGETATATEAARADIIIVDAADRQAVADVAREAGTATRVVIAGQSAGEGTDNRLARLVPFDIKAIAAAIDATETKIITPLQSYDDSIILPAVSGRAGP